ncbi:MAG: recJ [Candidatus Kaiserbacteria bacterium]|nr:recJ [Candidatus Kaiserbacteria bacterium]
MNEISPVSELVLDLLKKRGVIEQADINAFLAPDYAVHTHAPELFHDMDVAVARLFSAIEHNERIAVYADFDCDGIPGAAVLSDFFAKIEYENVEVYLPHRDREGYGFHTAAIAQLAARDVKLIITVDVGTAAIEAVKFAKGMGVDVIVTDHHEILDVLPDAVAVLNPKIAPYPFPHLCGAAVAFKLVQAVLRAGKEQGIERFMSVSDGWEKWLLDLVAIATVADMVELTGENRALVHWGLTVLRKSPRAGINALCAALRLRRENLTEDDIGFSIAPRVNAASRMGEPALALRLLTTRDRAEAEDLAKQLEKLNASRKGVVAGIVREARKRVSERYRDDQKVVVLGDPDWKPALLGLAANSIMNERGGMVCLWGRDANGVIKGSCRSDGDISVVALFEAATEAFIEYGGHSASGGFSVSPENIHTLPEVLEAAAVTLEKKGGKADVVHDAHLTLRELSWTLYKDVSRLAPFGMGNPKPVFRILGAQVQGIKRFGKEKNHVEVALVSLDSGSNARAFDFFRSPEDFTHVPVAGESAAIIATIERDTFRGGLALRIIDVLPT